MRWQNAKRDGMRRRLRKLEIDAGFARLAEGDEDEEDDEEVEEGVIDDGLAPGADSRMVVTESAAR